MKTVNIPDLYGVVDDAGRIVDLCPDDRAMNLVRAVTNPVTGVIKILMPDGTYASVPKQSDSGLDYIAYGLTLPTSGTIGVASIAAGVAYVSGVRVPHAGSVLSLTASSDNYVDIDYDGNIIVSAVANGGAAPAKAASSLRLGYVTTNTTSVTGSTTGAKDSNGVWMGNTSAVPFCRSVVGTLFASGGGENACTFGAGTTKYDNASIHSETVNPTRFTAQQAGIYSVVGFVQLNTAGPGAEWSIKIFKNGASAALGTVRGIDNVHLSLNASATVEMAVGDYLTLQRNLATSQNIAACGMSMIKVG